MKNYPAYLLQALLCLLVSQHLLHACSTYKITVHGKTMMGTNYDAWFTDPVIWFETDGYGAAFSGARREGANVAPQTGLNEHGLAFVSLATLPPENGRPSAGRKPIDNRSAYLKDILHTCKTVEEVKAYIEQYDHSTLTNDVFLYTDSAGHYLVAEPYVLTLGTDASYVLGNFCPSTITDFSTVNQARYINGSAFVKNRLDSSLAFCTALSDTMHVCRGKIGDGTLLTSILDLQRGIIHLYFYHDYTHHAQIDLREELTKGEHRIAIVSLFPPNSEYEKFVKFRTPGKSSALTSFLLAASAFFFVSGLFFLVRFFRSRGEPYRFLLGLLLPLCWIVSFYMLVLLRNEDIFYFPAPYSGPHSMALTLAAYIPFLLLIAVISFVIVSRKVFRLQAWGRATRWLFAVNALVFAVLICCFGYWGLYTVF
jgi:hypothetical protein